MNLIDLISNLACRMVNEVISIFTVPFLMQLFCTTINLCGCAFVAVFSQDSDGKNPIVVILIVTLIRFYLICRLGDDLSEMVFQN